MIVLVTGSMRSGTSLLCQLFSKCGVDFLGDAEPIPCDELNQRQHNPNGYFERLDVHQAYAALYLAFETKRRKVDLVHDSEIDMAHPAVAAFKDKIRALANRMHNTWGLKCIQMAQDPGLLNDVFLPAQQPVVWIYCFRTLKSVHQSMLHKCSGLPDYRIPACYWKNHNLRFLQRHSAIAFPVLFVCYETLMSAPQATLASLSTALVSLHHTWASALPDLHTEIQPTWQHFVAGSMTAGYSHAEKQVWDTLKLLETDFTYKTDAIKSLQLSEKPTQSPNALCLCGSKLKYKKCCISLT